MRKLLTRSVQPSQYEQTIGLGLFQGIALELVDIVHETIVKYKNKYEKSLSLMLHASQTKSTTTFLLVIHFTLLTTTGMLFQLPSYHWFSGCF